MKTCTRANLRMLPRFGAQLILLAAATSFIDAHAAPAPQVDRLHGAPESSRPGPGPRHPRTVGPQHPFASHEQQAQRRATASAAITWVACPPEAQSLEAMCGTLPVPLDRRHPKAMTINV